MGWRGAHERREEVRDVHAAALAHELQRGVERPGGVAAVHARRHLGGRDVPSNITRDPF